MTQPAVSVIVPTYNRAALLPRALASITAQTFGDWEIILVDDGSTDGTATLAAGFARRLGDRFRYLWQPNAGASAARNTGIDAARGAFVAFLDSDDEFLPTKLERHLELFNLQPSLGLVYADSAFVDLAGKPHLSVFDAMTKGARRVACVQVAPRMNVCTDSLFDSLLREYFISTISGVVRRQVLGAEVRFPVNCTYAEEWLFYLQIARRCQAGFVDEPLCRHHFTPGSVARSNVEANLRGRLEVLRAIVGRFPDLTVGQRNVMRRHCAQTYRELGNVLFHQARFAEARRCYWQGWRVGPTMAGFKDGVHALFKSLALPYRGWHQAITRGGR